MVKDEVSGHFGYFDPDESIANLSGNLPHWRQSQVTYFVTFRTADSMPRDKLSTWLHEREQWLKSHPGSHTPSEKREFYERFPKRFQDWLDRGYGACQLTQPEIKALVENALCFFDGRRYELDERVIMPNHVHVLVTPLGDHGLSRIPHAWKSFTAKAINERTGTTGSFWQKESFDHIVRSPSYLEMIRQYIRANPKETK